MKSNPNSFNSSRRTFVQQSSILLAAAILPFPFTASTSIHMTNNPHFDVIIIGGSYSGLAAGMSLGRALRKVLIIDGGNPCNKQTPHSHNFLTQDGQTPAAIASLAKEQVEKYKTVTFRNDLAVSGLQTTNGFEIATQSGSTFSAKKLIFATGIKDVMPEIEGFSDCWGVSVIHCPYCHGYEYSNEKTGILTNGDVAYEVSRLISNWTKDLTVFTNGIAEFAPNQTQKLSEHGIMINESVIDHFEHNNGYLRNIVFKDGSKTPITAIYARPEFEQHCAIPEQLGCELTEQGHISVDPFQKTTIRGVFACGDNTTFMRSVANSVAMGTLAGVMTNKEIIEDEF